MNIELLRLDDRRVLTGGFRSNRSERTFSSPDRISMAALRPLMAITLPPG